jgi:hypothetical protein
MVFHGCAVRRASTTTVMEAMDGGAFRSLVAVVNVTNSAIVSMGERIIRGSRIRLFQDPTKSTHRSAGNRHNGASRVGGKCCWDGCD